MSGPIIEPEKIQQTIKKIPEDTFTILDFMDKFKELFPDDWEILVERYGLFGEKRRYTVATYPSNRLYKPNPLLKPFRKYESGGGGDFRRATKEEREVFGSP